MPIILNVSSDIESKVFGHRKLIYFWKEKSYYVKIL
nr:MAG TPA: hypothetical protein [Caudoviricetes sp.]